jgi:acyl carrier protein
LVADVLGVPVEGVKRETSYNDVPAWDSLNIVKLAMAVEVEFDVAITADDAINFTSVSAILEVLRQKGTP